MPHLVVLIGNGLSIAANENLRLAALTQAFLAEHADDREDLDRLLAEVDLGAVDPATDFEGIVAGLESAEEVVSAFMSLASRVDHADLQQAAQVLRDGGVPGLIRRLYYAYCAEVLQAIGQLTRGDLAAPVVAFADWLKELYEAHGFASIFTLNYDLLLERMLIDDNVLGLRYRVTDFFSGLPERTSSLPLGDAGAGVQGRLFCPRRLWRCATERGVGKRGVLIDHSTGRTAPPTIGVDLLVPANEARNWTTMQRACCLPRLCGRWLARFVLSRHSLACC